MREHPRPWADQPGARSRSKKENGWRIFSLCKKFSVSQGAAREKGIRPWLYAGAFNDVLARKLGVIYYGRKKFKAA